MQFHPTTLAPTGVLITEGCRGEGAFLLNTDGERFLKHYAPNAMELASRDVISRAEQTEIDEGRGIDGNVMLDLRHLGAEQDPRAAARHARALDGVRRRRPDLRPDPGPARRSLPHGRRRHRRLGPHRARRPLRGRRGRLHLGPRRQPARRQRADGDDHVRPARRRGRGRRARSAGARRGSRSRGARRRAPSCASLLDRSEGERPVADPRRARRDDARELRRLPPRGADGGAGARSSRGCASDSIASSSRTRETSSTTTSRRRSSSVSCSSSPRAWSRPGSRARRAAARTRGRTTIPDRDDENFLRHTMSRWVDGRARARLEAGHDHEVAAGGAGLLMRRVLLLRRSSSSSPRAAAVGDKGSGNPLGGRRRSDRARKGSELATTDSNVVTPTRRSSSTATAATTTKTAEGWQHYAVEAGHGGAEPRRDFDRQRRSGCKSPLFGDSSRRQGVDQARHDEGGEGPRLQRSRACWADAADVLSSSGARHGQDARRGDGRRRRDDALPGHDRPEEGAAAERCRTHRRSTSRRRVGRRRRARPPGQARLRTQGRLDERHDPRTASR